MSKELDIETKKFLSELKPIILSHEYCDNEYYDNVYYYNKPVFDKNVPEIIKTLSIGLGYPDQE